MTKFNLVVMGLCFIIFIQQIVLTSRPAMVIETNSAYSFPTYDGKVIIGTKAIKKENLERLVNVVGSSEKTQSLANRFGVEIEDAPQEYHQERAVVYDIEPWRHSSSGGTQDNDMPFILSEMMEELEDFFRRNPGKARDILRTYKKLKYEQWFWDKIDKFVDENK